MIAGAAIIVAGLALVMLGIIRDDLKEMNEIRRKQLDAEHAKVLHLANIIYELKVLNLHLQNRP